LRNTGTQEGKSGGCIPAFLLSLEMSTGWDSRVSRNVRSRCAILRDLGREPFAPFQKFSVAGALPPFLRPISRARPKTQDRAAGKIVNRLNVNQTVKNHVADYFYPKTE